MTDPAPSALGMAGHPQTSEMNARNSTEHIVPTSTFLQELLRERKADEQKLKASRFPNTGLVRRSSRRNTTLVPDETVTHSSPLWRGHGESSASQGRRASGVPWARNTSPREMGARESEEVRLSDM